MFAVILFVLFIVITPMRIHYCLSLSTNTHLLPINHRDFLRIGSLKTSVSYPTLALGRFGLHFTAIRHIAPNNIAINLATLHPV